MNRLAESRGAHGQLQLGQPHLSHPTINRLARAVVRIANFTRISDMCSGAIGLHWLPFLGFTHVWGQSRKGKNVVRQITAKDRYARALATVTE